MDVDVRALKDRAAALMQARRYSHAVTAFAEAMKLAPKDPALRLRHAEAALRAGQSGLARQSLLSAASLFAADGKQAQAEAALRRAASFADGSEALTG
jgi:Flp pilus assembly protein TadD